VPPDHNGVHACDARIGSHTDLGRLGSDFDEAFGMWGLLVISRCAVLDQRQWKVYPHAGRGEVPNWHISDLTVCRPMSEKQTFRTNFERQRLTLRGPSGSPTDPSSGRVLVNSVRIIALAGPLAIWLLGDRWVSSLA
jgi:hypothetical protein